MKDSVRIPKKLSFNRHRKGQEQFWVLCFLHQKFHLLHQLHCWAGKTACEPCMTSETHVPLTYKITGGGVTVSSLVQTQWKEKDQKPFSL